MKFCSSSTSKELRRLGTHPTDAARRCTSLLESFAFLLAPVLPAALPAAAQAHPAAAQALPASASPAGGCQLNSPRGNIKHVVTIIFDNTHFQRDALVAQIVRLLEAAEFNGTPIRDATADSLIQQAQSLRSSVEAYASGL